MHIHDPELREKTNDFAEAMNSILLGVLGPEIPLLNIDNFQKNNSKNMIKITTPAINSSGAPAPIYLYKDKIRIMKLSVWFHCIWDSENKFLAVEKCSANVTSILDEEDQESIIRYDYDKKNADAWSSAAHINLYTMNRYIDEYRINYRDKFVNLHLPVGGDRFRPCLEDVLSLLIRQFKIDTYCDVQEAEKILQQGRSYWRKKQILAVIRDCPDLAEETLLKMGYTVIPPTNDNEISRHSTKSSILYNY